MSLYYVIVIGAALAMDAFGVAIGIGVNDIIESQHRVKFIISFAFFQFFFTYSGGKLGYLFDRYITNIPALAGGIIMSIVGVLMIIDGLKEKENTLLIKNSTCIILGISVSIDALVIGFTVFHQINNELLLLADSILIGLITMFISTLAFFICRYIKKIEFITKYADFLGGIALIIFGLKMIFF